MSGGAGYAQRHLEHSDYYDEGRRVQGEWHGQGAELLGLCGEVTREQFEAVREGLHPETGEFLRPRHSADRIDANGSEQSKGRSLYDLTFSAPKSVAIQALVGGHERLIAAHDNAVREALAEAENYAAARVRLNGVNENRAILSADAMKQELFYVGASRDRQEIVVVTSDCEQLRNLLGISTARPSATEL